MRLIVGAAMVVVSLDLSAQQTVTISGEVVCPQCRIELTQVATIGTFDGPGYLGAIPLSMARDSRGRVYIVPEGRVDAVPAVFNGDGTFLTRLGRLGGGPGEYRGASTIAVDPTTRSSCWTGTTHG